MKGLPCLAATILAFWLPIAGATTYYVDYAGGSDASSGLDKSHAWQRHPYMGGWTGSYSHSAGDHFIFKGGVTWPSGCFGAVVKLGGSSGNPDVYTVDKTWFAGGSWSRPVFDCGSVRAQGIFVGTLSPYSASAHYVTLDNLEIKNWYWPSGYNRGQAYGITFADGAHNITIQNCYLHDWTHGTVASGTRDAFVAIFGESINPWNASCIVSNTVIDGGAANATDFSSSGWGIGPFGGVITNCTIRNCVSAVMPAYNAEIGGCDLGPSWNSFDQSGYAHDNLINTIFGGIHYFHDNLIHDGKSINILLEGNGGETDYLWNNVIWGCTQNAAISINDDNGAKVFAWNNTIVPGSYPAFRMVHQYGGTLGVLSIVDTHLITAGSLLDNSAGVPIAAYTNAFTITTAPAAATSQGYTSSNQYAPTSGSGDSVIDGQSLSGALSGRLVTDILAAARPGASGWNVGAYQYLGVAPDPPDTPTNSSPVEGSTGVSLTPVLQISGYSDPRDSAQAASRWWIYASDGTTLVWDSGDQGPATSFYALSAGLATSTTYKWQAAGENSLSLWSDRSPLTSFTTQDPPPPPEPGTNVVTIIISNTPAVVRGLIIR